MVFGKTVFAKTLMGFYEYEGNIWIGETNLKSVSPKSVRDYIGIALQDTYLFHDTILNNVNITNKERYIQESCPKRLLSELTCHTFIHL